MSTPTLSKKQQRKSLSAKKTPAKGLRNVLAQPYESYWPILKNDHANALKCLLNTLMPAVKRPSVTVPWAELRKMKKAERRVARKDAQEKSNFPEPDKKVLDSIVIGVNGVTRLLEKNGACCVLLDAKVEPLLLVKHIVTMAQLKNVPVILVSFLKTVTLETVGFACAAIALKEHVSQSADNHFHNLYKKVAELAIILPTPNHPVQLFHLEDELESTPAPNEPRINVENLTNKKKQSKTCFTLSTNVYKYRNTRKTRVFIPEGESQAQTAADRSWGDFITIDKDSSFEVDSRTEGKGKTKGRYVNIHREVKESLSASKTDTKELDGYISFSCKPDATKISDDEMSENNGEIMYETKTKVLGDNMDTTQDTNPDRRDSGKTGKKSGYKYISLKVKRLQGNPNRIKATKIPKPKKK